MDTWLEWARGPLFRFALAILLLGLARMLFLSGVGLANSIYRAGDRRLQLSTIFQSTLKWLLPFQEMKRRPVYSITSILFHVGLILTPLFLAGHIMLWKRGIGVSWPSLDYGVVDGLTVLTILTGVGLTIARIARPGPRSYEDIFLPSLLITPFLFGFLVMHPGLNPLPYEAVMLVHVLSADLILILIPFTKMAHVVLLPSALVSKLGLRLLSYPGEKAGIALQEEKELI